MERSTGSVYEPFFSELDITPLPFVKGIPTDPAVPAGFGYIMGNLLDVPNNPPSPFLVSDWIVVYRETSPSVYAISLSEWALGVNRVCQF
jgi:hypothetical protein